MPVDDVPVIIPIVKWSGRVIGYTCFVAALPTVAWFFLCELLCIATSTNSAVVQALLALPRFAVLLATAPVWLAQPVVLGYFLRTVSTTIAVIAALAFFGVALFGLIYSQFDHYLKACNFRDFMFKKRHGGYWWCLGQSFLDFFAVLAALVSVASVVRIPALLVMLYQGAIRGKEEHDDRDFPRKRLSNDRTLRTELFYCAMMVVVDLFTLPFLLLLVFVPWRTVGLRKRIAKKTNWEALALIDTVSVRRKIIVAALNGILDIPCFATLAFFVFTPWRFRELKLKDKTVNERRVEVLGQFGQCLLDLFFMFLGIIVVITLWRAVPLIRGVATKHKDMDAQRRRAMAGWQLLLFFYDLFVFLNSVPILLITVYRIPRLIHKWRKVDSTWGFVYKTDIWEYTRPRAQNRMQLQALYVWRDIPFFVMGFFVLLSWRVWFLVRGLWRIDHPLDAAAQPRRPGHERRRLVAHQFGQYLIDIPIVLLAAVATILFLWRSVIMWYDIKHATSTSARRKAILRNFFEFFVDLPFAIFALIVTCLIWRAFFMWRDVYRMWKPVPRTHDQWDTRRCLARHFGLLFVDLIDVPFALLSLGIVITGWRLPAFIRALRACNTRNQRRIVAIKELGLWLLDIPTFLACFVVLITVYRAKTMCTALGKHLSAFFREHPPVPADVAPAAAPAPVAHDEDNPAPALAAQEAPTRGTWHPIVWANFGLVMLDIPFPLLLLLTLWRLPWCVRRLIRECESARERRILILQYLLLMVKDIPCIILFVPILLTVWRVPSVVQMFKKLERGDNEHRLFLAIFWQWVIDLPFAFMFLWTILCAWRAFFVVRSILMHCTDAKSRRKRIAAYFGHTFLDILLGLLCVFNTIFFFWRFNAFRRAYSVCLREQTEEQYWRHSTSFYIAVLATTGNGFIDLPFVFLGILHTIFLWRFFFYLRFILYTKWSQTDKYRRRATLRYFGMSLMDILVALGQLFVVLCFWRVLTFRRKMRKELAKMRVERQDYERTVEAAVTANTALPPEQGHFALSFAWYVAVARTLVDIFADFPYIFMGAFVLLCPWRVFGYLRQIVTVVKRPVEQHIRTTRLTEHQSGKHDRYRRWITFWYFMHSLADISCACLLVPSLIVALWRIPTFVVVTRLSLNDYPHSFWRHSMAWNVATLYTFAMTLRDLWMLFSVLVILVSAGHVPCLIRDFIDFTKLKKWRDQKLRRRAAAAHAREHPPGEQSAIVPPRPKVKIPRPDISPDSFGIWHSKTKHRMNNEELAPIPLSPTIFFDAIHYEFKHSIAFVPNLLLAPLKLLALLVVPFYFYVNWRLGVKTSLFGSRPAATAAAAPVPEDRTPWEKVTARKSLSFVVFPAYFVQELAVGTFTLTSIQDVLILVCCSFPLLLWNELGFVSLFANHVLLLAITWFDPIWSFCRRSAGYTYGSPPNAFWVLFELFYSLSLAVMVPVFFLIQAFYLLLPIIVFGSTRFPTTPGFVEFWKVFFSRVFWSDYVPAITTWMWVISAVWWFALIPGWHLTIKHSKMYELFEPLNVYILLVKRVIAGTIWKGYKAILSHTTTWSYVHRRTCCFIGQWIIALMFVIWCGWPFLAVIIASKYWSGWYWLFFFSVPVSVFLVWKGYISVKKHWKAPPIICREGLSNVTIYGEFPAHGGIQLIIDADKHPDLVLRQAILKIEGDELWRKMGEVVKGGPKLITTFKILFYPVKLVPSFLNPADFVSGRSHIHTVIAFGTSGKLIIKKKLILRYAQRIVDIGDPEFRLVVEFGDKTFRWVKYGELCSVTTRLSTVLRCVEQHLPLPIPRADGTIPELPPVAARTEAPTVPVELPPIAGPVRMEVDDAARATLPLPPPPPRRMHTPPHLQLPPTSAATATTNPTVASMREQHRELIELAE